MSNILFKGKPVTTHFQKLPCELLYCNTSFMISSYTEVSFPNLSYCVYLFVHTRLITAELPLRCICLGDLISAPSHFEAIQIKIYIRKFLEVRTTLMWFAIAMMKYPTVKSNVGRKVFVYNSQVTLYHHPGKSKQELKARTLGLPDCGIEQPTVMFPHQTSIKKMYHRLCHRPV